MKKALILLAVALAWITVMFYTCALLQSCASYAVPQACYVKALDLADDYRSELKTLCKGYELNLESCPDYQDIEDRYAARRRHDAEACTP